MYGKYITHIFSDLISLTPSRNRNGSNTNVAIGNSSIDEAEMHFLVMSPSIFIFFLNDENVQLFEPINHQPNTNVILFEPINHQLNRNVIFFKPANISI